MSWLVKQVFIALLGFSGSLATKLVSWNNEHCMARPTLIDLNPIELDYYPLMVSIDKSNGICNTVDNVSTKICVPSERKDVNVKVLSTITRIYEAKTLTKLTKHVSCDCKCKFDSITCNSNQEWNNDKYQCECKKYHMRI